MSELVERLTKKWDAFMNDTEDYYALPLERDTHFWLNAIADELEAECAGLDGWIPRSGFSVVRWLRGEPEFPESRTTHESETTEKET